MDFGNVSEILPVIIAIIGVIVLQVFMRKNRNPVSSQQHIIQSLMSDIRINIRLVDILMRGEQIKRFSVTGWKLYKDKIDFLSQPVRTALTEAYEIAEDYNGQVASTRKYSTANYIAGINTGKMKEKLEKSKSGIEEWLMVKTGTSDSAGKTGFFDGLLGR